MDAVKEAAREWPEDWLKKIVKMPAFKKYCVMSAFDQSDESLIAEAKRYAGPDRVKEVLEPSTGFGTL